jgi:hypothetical protein
MIMKITVSKPNNSSIVIEGDITEMNSIIDRIIFDEDNTVTVTKIKPAATMQVDATNSNDSKKIAEFLSSIYSYPANSANYSGRGRAIADMICDGKPHTYDEILTACNSVRKTVANNISRLRAAGAKININDETITFVSVPNKRYTKKKWAARVPSGTTVKAAPMPAPTFEGASTNVLTPVATAIAGMRLS